MSSPHALPRTIIHVDLDAFYCTVEELSDPALCGRAFAVGGRADERGVVASGSYAARSFGLRSAMAMGMAQRLCPHLLVVPPRHSHYRAVSAGLMELLRSFTPLLEQLSIDEAFLDVSGLLANDDIVSGGSSAARTLALEIQRCVFEELGLSCSLGMASNKMVAKIATDCGKATATLGQSPRALCVVPPGEEAAFLAPLRVSALWGVGPKMEAHLQSLGIETIGALAEWDERDLARRFGKHGVELARHARGIDRREVITERERKSISSETTFLHDVGDWETLHATLGEQTRSVAAQLQGQKLQANTVKIKIRWSNFSYSTRQMTLPRATDAAPTIEVAATALLRQIWGDAAPVRLLGVGVSGLSPVRQLGLFDSIPEMEASPMSVPYPIEVKATQEVCSPQKIVLAPVIDERRQRLRETLTRLEARFGSVVVHLGATTRSESS
ncbi:DNA polymerase IV [Abditibacteriota bacterium]|nr:DNA polymerase IV [Abditibacteriota bacterium]